MIEEARRSPERGADTIDNAEMRSLLAAVQSGYEAVRGDPRLARRRHAAQTTASRARRGLDDLDLRLRSGTIRRLAGEATEARTRAARSRRPARWLRAIRWPVVLSVGVFDTWYFSTVFRFLTSSTGDRGREAHGFAAFMERFAAVAPGLVLAITLAACGAALLHPLRAWSSAARRRAASRDISGEPSPRRTDQRAGGLRDLAVRHGLQLLPVGFVAIVLYVVADWAGLRARPGVDAARQGYPLEAVMLLMIVLSLGAIAVKIMADDPDGEDEAAARRRLAVHRAVFLWRSRRASTHLGAHESAWSDLRTLRDELLGLLRLKSVSAWEAFILRTRALHHRAGDITATPVDGSPVIDETGRLALPEFENLRQPRPELGPLLEICRLIVELDPSALRQRKERIDAEYLRQLADGQRPAGTHRHPPEGR